MVDLISHKSTLQMDADEKMARMLQFQEYFRSEVPTSEHRPWLEVMRSHNLGPFGSEMHSRLDPIPFPEGQNILNTPTHPQQDLQVTRLCLHNSSYLVPSSMLAQGGSITMTNEQGEIMTITVTGRSITMTNEQEGVMTMTGTGDSFPRTELSTFSPVKINLDKEKYDTMIKDLYFNEKFADTSCAICQEDFKNKENLKITPCEHIFHPKCISTWLEKECTRPTCPSCRHDCREKLNNDSKPR